MSKSLEQRLEQELETLNTQSNVRKLNPCFMLSNQHDLYNSLELTNYCSNDYLSLASHPLITCDNFLDYFIKFLADEANCYKGSLATDSNDQVNFCALASSLPDRNQDPNDHIFNNPELIYGRDPKFLHLINCLSSSCVDQRYLIKLCDYFTPIENSTTQKYYDLHPKHPIVHGNSSSSSPLLTGYNQYQILQDRLLAKIFDESFYPVSYPSGYHMNTGVLAAISSSKTLILADKLVHASLIDGMRLSTAKWLRFKHNDIEHLQALLEAHHQDYAEIIIVVEALYSMDGDHAPLAEIVELKRRYDNLVIYVDEAHSFGVYGKHGQGYCSKLGLSAEIDIIVATLGKSMGSHGGFVMCKSKIMRDYLINKSRSLIFSTALPPLVNFNSCCNLLSLLYRDEDLQLRRQLLIRRSEILNALIYKKLGDTPSSSYIVPVIVGDNEKAILLSEILAHNGILALPIREPTVPKGQARVRISLNACLSDESFDNLMLVLTKVRMKHLHQYL